MAAVWGIVPAPEPNKKGKKYHDRSSSPEDTLEDEVKRLQKVVRDSKRAPKKRRRESGNRSRPRKLGLWLVE